MATLKFTNIQKIYPNHVQAVFDFNLDINDKEFIVFVGPSGCGKSTTLRMVAGLEDISDGELYIDNKLVNFIDPKERNIAMVFQSYALYPHMTVYDNIAFSLKIRKADKPVLVPSEERDRCLKELTELRRALQRALKKSSKGGKDREKYEQEAYKLKDSVKEKITELHTYDNYQTGICTLLIKRNKALISQSEKEITSLKKQIESGEKQIQDMETKLKEMENDSELNNEKGKDKIDKFTKKLDYDRHILNTLRIELSSKEQEHENAKKDFEYYSNTQTTLLENRHLTKNEILEEVLHAGEILDLFKCLGRKPAALSGGQRQRVALGRAIVRKPKVFLMDEPLSNLDAKLRTQTRIEIAQIHKEVGATTIYVTHDQVEALTLADRIVIMKDGVIQQVCTPKEAYENPANMFVAGFIGSPSTNFLSGEYDGKAINIPSGEKDKLIIKLTEEMNKKLTSYKGKEIVVGVRPEFMHLKSEYLGKDDVASLKLTSKEIELIGHEFIVYFDIAGKKLSAKTSSQAQIQPKDTNEYVIELSKIHIFDPETTKVIL